MGKKDEDSDSEEEVEKSGSVLLSWDTVKMALFLFILTIIVLSDMFVDGVIKAFTDEPSDTTVGITQAILITLGYLLMQTVNSLT
jgi:hypothetical protein